jgi:hypothetical protein
VPILGGGVKMKINAIDMPKLESPFKREVVNGIYVCVPKIEEGYGWVFEEGVLATEKLDGTNMSIEVKDGQIINVRNRKNIIDIWEKGNKRFVVGVMEAIEKEYIKLSNLGDGMYFGELIGEMIQENPYKIEGQLWIPFETLKEKCKYKFWDGVVEEMKGMGEREKFEKVRDIFKGLWSLFKRQKGMKGEVSEKTGFEGMAAEGIVFYGKDGQMAKLRRDMFDWFVGERHEGRIDY